MRPTGGRCSGPIGGNPMPNAVVPLKARASLDTLAKLGAKSRYPHARLLAERMAAIARELQAVLDLEAEEARNDKVWVPTASRRNWSRPKSG